MERQKLDFTRPMLQERCSRLIASVPEKHSQSAENSRAILFAREHSGRPKHGNNLINQNSEFPAIVPLKLPYSADIIPSRNCNGKLGIIFEDEEDAWSDKCDTISSSASYLENFRISTGWSDLEESDADPQTKSFIMRRFLRAAKAMSSETSPHSSRKMHVNRKEESKCITMSLKAGNSILAPDYRVTLSCSKCCLETHVEEECIEESMNDEEVQSHCRLLHLSCILSPFQRKKMLPRARTQSDHKASKTRSRVFKDARRFTEHSVSFHDKTNIVPPGNSLFNDIRYLSQAEEKKGLKTEITLIPQLPLPPSDSWLQRALASSSSENHMIRSFHQFAPKHYIKNQDAKQMRIDSKWETMVKTSNLQQGHLLNSQVMLTAPTSEFEALNIST